MDLYSIYYDKNINEYLMTSSTTKKYSYKVPLNFNNMKASFLNFSYDEEGFMAYVNIVEGKNHIPLIQNKTKQEIINKYPELFI